MTWQTVDAVESILEYTDDEDTTLFGERVSLAGQQPPPPLFVDGDSPWGFFSWCWDASTTNYCCGSPQGLLGSNNTSDTNESYRLELLDQLFGRWNSSSSPSCCLAPHDSPSRKTKASSHTTTCDYSPSCGIHQDLIFLYCAAADRGRVVLVEKATTKRPGNNHHDNDDLYDSDDDGFFLSDLLLMRNSRRSL